MTNNPPTALQGNELKKFIRSQFGIRVPTSSLPLFESVWHTKTSVQKESENNERLSFLGENVLNCVLVAYLYEKFPYMDITFLEELRNRIAHHARLSRMAQRLQITGQPASTDENALLLRDHINSDVLKALIGAITLCNGYETAAKLIQKQLKQQEQTIKELSSDNPNYKGKIMAWGQRNKAEIRFKLTKEIKYNGKNLHVVSLYINNEWVANGCDLLVKNAEQHASLNALDSLSIHNEYVQ
jgi:ribonuclease-3